MPAKRDVCVCTCVPLDYKILKYQILRVCGTSACLNQTNLDLNSTLTSIMNRILDEQKFMNLMGKMTSFNYKWRQQIIVVFIISEIFVTSRNLRYFPIPLKLLQIFQIITYSKGQQTFLSKGPKTVYKVQIINILGLVSLVLQLLTSAFVVLKQS